MAPDCRAAVDGSMLSIYFSHPFIVFFLYIYIYIFKEISLKFIVKPSQLQYPKKKTLSTITAAAAATTIAKGIILLSYIVELELN